MEVQKEKEGNWYWKLLQPGDVVILLDEGGRNALHRVCRLYEAQDEYREQTAGIYYRRPLRILPKVRSGTREDVLSRMTFPIRWCASSCGSNSTGRWPYWTGAVSSWMMNFSSATPGIPYPRVTFLRTWLSWFGTFMSRSHGCASIACGSLATIYR